MAAVAAATTTTTTTTTRKVSALKQWLKSQGIFCSKGLQICECPIQGISIRALRDLSVGDVVAIIPKLACLTVQTTGARDLIKSSDNNLALIKPSYLDDNNLGLSVAIMYERSLGQRSPWAPYLNVLPYQECLPLVWAPQEVETLLRGTELRKVVKEERIFMCMDWKMSILPLLESKSSQLDPSFFGLQDFFAAMSLVHSRSFMLDEDFHGFGMVPLVDLFNHKTAAEDVHYTSFSLDSESESDSEAGDDQMNDQTFSYAYNNKKYEDDSERKSPADFPSGSGDEPEPMEMIMVKNVKAGSEVYNTYGPLGNARLLQMFGFTEPDNPYDIVNIDMKIVLEWSSSLFSSSHSSSRVFLWKRLGVCGCDCQDYENFEISFDGEPKIELLTLLYIMLLPEDACGKLNSAACNYVCGREQLMREMGMTLLKGTSEPTRDMFMNKSVGKALLSVANIRERLYGSNSLEDDIEALEKCCCVREKKLYHSLMLRICERRILQKLRSYAAKAASLKTSKRASTRKKLKKT